MDITLTIRITQNDWTSTSPTITREVRLEYPDDYDMLVRMNFGAIADDTVKAAVAAYLAARLQAANEGGAQ